MINEALLSEAKHLLGAESDSSAVNLALAEAIKISKLKSLTEYFGTDVWSGSLKEMRGDRPRKASKRRA